MSRNPPAPDASKTIRVLHVCETLVGGPASYLDELLPRQRAEFGAANVAVLGPASQLGYLRNTAGVSLLSYKRSGRDLGSLVNLTMALIRVSREFRPTIVHLHSTFAGVIGRSLPRFSLNGARIVYCAHCWAMDPSRETTLKSLQGKVEGLLAGRASAIVNVSPHEEAFLGRWGIRPPKARTIVSGISDWPGGVRPESSRGGKEIQLLFLGRAERQKGLDILIREARLLDRDDVKIIIAGAKADDGFVLGSMPPNVEFVGWVDHARVGALLAQSDALVMPSRWEGWPLAALEASRASRAIIASNQGPFPFMIEGRVSGILADIKKPGFLGEALQGVDRSALIEMGRRARQRYESSFTEARMNQGIVDLYRELVSVPVRGSPRLVGGRVRWARLGRPVVGVRDPAQMPLGAGDRFDNRRSPKPEPLRSEGGPHRPPL